MSDILHKIVEHKRGEIAAAKSRISAAELESQLVDAPPVRDFVEALRRKAPLALIAEVKKASPSKGVIRADFDPIEIARTYAAAGAACLSVLTDEKFFQGHLDYLKRIRGMVRIPLLRKDFILDRYQILEARLAGADAVLLIAECLSSKELTDLHQYARQLGMHTLIELYDPANLAKVMQVNPELVGVNNRDLRTFNVDLHHSMSIRRQVPSSVVFVSESGIESRSDVVQLQEGAVNAILVGETFMRASDIGAKVRELLGTS
jgi:indole-3-glycerol phosphate synthase